MKREFYNAGIIGVGLNMPEEVRKNSFWDDIEIVNLTRKERNPFEGIEERRAFPEDTVPSDVETEAARRAILDAGISPDDIDLVLVHSMLQDETIPGNASLVQHKLGLKNAGAWNIDTCCSSFVTMFITASNLIAMGTFKNILIVTSVLHTQMLDYTHYISPSLGDGAAAVVMGRVSDGKGYITSHNASNGAYHDAFTLRNKICSDPKEKHYKPVSFKPVLVFNDETAYKIGKNSVKDMMGAIEVALEKANLKPQDIDFLLTHQPVHWAHNAWRDALGIPETKSYQSFKHYGNLASTTIPTNIFEARDKGMLKDGDTVLMASSGAGENFSIAIFKWGK